MNTQSNNAIVRIVAAILVIACIVPTSFAGQTDPHNPYTIYGLRLRTHLTPNTPGANEDLGPLVFQEIVPCRFVSTL